MRLGISVMWGFHGGCSHMVIECEGAGRRWLREWTFQSGKRSTDISQVGGLSGTAEPHPERGVCAAIAGTMMSWPQTGGSDPPVLARRATRGWVHKSWGKRASLLVGAWGRRGHGARAWVSLADTNNLHICWAYRWRKADAGVLGMGCVLVAPWGRRHHSRAALAG